MSVKISFTSKSQTIITIKPNKKLCADTQGVTSFFVFLTILMKTLLLPISFLYAIALKIRHKMFDYGIIRSKKFSIPTICIGNLELGGTGKTPLTEYVTRLLMATDDVAIVSGGYKRKSKGIVIANTNSTLDELGDEPMQYHHKFGDKINVAVGKDRCQVIGRLIAEKRVSAIILDDALQHRKILSGLNILTTNFLNPFFNNHLLPAGTLRDLKSRAKAADIAVVNKTPDDATDEQKNHIRREMARYGIQKVFFASMAYGKPTPCNEIATHSFPDKDSDIVALCGIAQPDYFMQHIENEFDAVKKIIFDDHHDFSKNDVETIKKACDDKKIIVTTEKDAMRLTNNHYFSALKNVPIYYIPIEVEFDDEASQFNKEIMDYVRKNN